MRTPRLLTVVLLSLILPALPTAAQQTDSQAGTETTPLLAGIVDLSSLSLLWGDSPDSSGGNNPAGAPEPLDIAATAQGPILLFSDRLLSLGVNLEITTRTVRDLTFLPRLPDGIVPTRVLLNPLSEPIVYEADSGALHLLHQEGGDSERFETDLPHAVEACSLRSGGILLSQGNSLNLFSRRGKELTRREIPLPHGFTTGLSSDQKDRLWVYDLAARQVRIFAASGEQLSVITPDISGGTLLFPQVFQARSDGGFFLGSAGELWCFNADGSVRWRLSQFSAGFRQALPAFYRLAAAAQAAAARRSFYILDPLGNRILKFVENPPGDSQGGGRSSETIDAALAAAFRSSENGPSRQSEVLRLCLEEELYLQAAFFRRSGDEDTPVVTDLAERLRAKQARLLAELAEQLENQLHYAEAETAYNRALSLFRQLRNLDPVDPRYPDAIRELSEQRNSLRRIRVAQSFLTVRILEDGLKAGGGSQELAIALTNTSAVRVQQVEVLARFGGYTASRWQASLSALPPGQRVLLTIPIFEGGAGAPEASTRLNAEDLAIPCNLLVRYVHNREKGAEHFRIPIVFPAGTLRLPADE